MKNEKKNFSNECHWGQYSKTFSAITTIYQSQMYRHIASNIKGRVLDVGCGSAKFAAYVAPMKGVTEYVGVECSHDMASSARSTIRKLDAEGFSIITSTIEDFCSDNLFDVVVSTNSYYAWSEPEMGLEVIYRSLKFGGNFFLVTPNSSLDMTSLLKESSKELLMHPGFDEFSLMNFQFVKDMGHNFVSMDELVKKVLAVGFKLKSCNTDYFNGGVNYLHVHK